MSTTHNYAATVNLPAAALAKVREFSAAEKDLPAATAGLRIGVLPGGCSGFKYEMSIDESAAEDDILLDIEGVRVFVDPFSAQYLNGVQVDYVATMQSQGFAVENPNQTRGLGS